LCIDVTSNALWRISHKDRSATPSAASLARRRPLAERARRFQDFGGQLWSSLGTQRSMPSLASDGTKLNCPQRGTVLRKAQGAGGRCATATAIDPSGRRYFPSPNQVTGSPVSNEQWYSGFGEPFVPRLITKRRWIRQVERSGSLTMTSANRVIEAICLPPRPVRLFRDMDCLQARYRGAFTFNTGPWVGSIHHAA